MRRIGTLENSELAQRFCDYLVTQSIDASCDPESDSPDSSWDIWVRDERQIEQSKKISLIFGWILNSLVIRSSERPLGFDRNRLRRSLHGRNVQRKVSELQMLASLRWVSRFVLP